MPTPPVAIDALPPAPNPDSDEVAFDNAAWTWASALPNFRSQFNASASVTYTNAQEAVAAASAAAGSATTAANQVSLATAQAAISTAKAGEASASASAASASASDASTSATAAANSAAAAAALAGAFVGTSTSSVAIGIGNKSFVTQAGELYTKGVFMTAVSQANPANYMFGQVDSYDGNTGALVLTVQATGGSGTFADWNLSLTGARGAQGVQGPAGSLNGGSLLGALEELKGANIPSAPTVNVWAIVGNSATLTGAVQINSFGTAPQPGAKRTLIAAAATPLAHGANLLLPGAANYTTSVGDRLEIFAETTTQHRVSIWKADGTAVVSGGVNSVGATVTNNITLTAASAVLQVVEMAAAGRSITLPDATTLSVGSPKFLIDNSTGQFPVGVRNTAGLLLTAIGAGGNCCVSLKDKSTAAGVWSVSGNGLEPGLITAERSLGFASSKTLAPYVALDDNVSIHFKDNGSSGFSAYVVDNLGKAITSPTLVDSMSNPTVCTAFKISATQAIVFYGSGLNDHRARVITLTGSSPSYGLSVGSQAQSTATYQANPAGPWSGEDFMSDPKVVQLSGSQYLFVGRDGSNNVVGFTINVSGSTVAFGAVSAALLSVASSCGVLPLTATTALVWAKNGGPAPYVNNAQVVSVSGTAVAGGGSIVVGLNSTVNTPPSMVLMSATEVVLADDHNTADQAHAVALTIAGTTVSAGPRALFDSNAGSMAFSANNTGRYNPKLWKIDATRIGYWSYGSTGSGTSKHSMLVKSGSSVNLAITVGDGFTRTGAEGSGGSAGYGQMLPQGASEFLSIRQQLNASAGFGLQLLPAKISIAMNEITAGAGEAFREGYQQSPVEYTMGRTSSGDYLLFGKGAPSVAGPAELTVVRSNGDRAIKRGRISIPQIAIASTVGPFPLAVVGTNRVVLMGETPSSEGAIRRSKAYNVELAV